MRAELPVMEGAYQRFIDNQEETPGAIYGAERERAREHAAKAAFMAMQELKTTANSGTSLPQDTLLGGVVHIYTTRMRTLPENRTNTVVHELFKVNLSRFYGFVDQTTARCLIGLTPASTSQFTTSVLGAATGSATAEQPIEERYPWLRVLYDLVRTGQNAKALKLIYASVEDHFKSSDIIGLGSILGLADVSRLNAQTATALLRVSGRAKRAMPSWRVFLQRTRTELEKQNVPNLPALFVGLGD